MLLPKVAAVPAFLVVLASHVSAYPAISPTRIAYDSLDDAISINLLDGLTIDGVVSVTGIPSFDEVKRGLMSHLHACIMSIDGDVTTEHYPDGTIRRSFAASTMPNGAGPRPIKSLEDFVAGLPPPDGSSELESCQLFLGHLASFRSTVDRVTEKFAERLSAEMGSSLPKPLLLNSDPSGQDYGDIAEVVSGGVHLEHFHSYQGENRAMGVDDGETIQFHTDQGFFIAFTPGLIISPDGVLELSDGFFVQDSNGEKQLMEFTIEDDLVFMLGDGVNQIINNKLDKGHTGLRATPHALTLTAHDDHARVWYGRMVLAPNDAYFPSVTGVADSTFGEVRQFIIESSTNGDIPMGIGCSTPNMKAVITTARSLEEGNEEATACTEDELFCWFRCMALADYNLTFDSCIERNLQVQCMNPRGQVLENGEGHGDYFPECTNRTHESNPVTEFPMIDQQDAAVCTSEKWDEFIGADGYDHMMELTLPNGTETYLLWSVIEDGAGSKKVKARLAFDNVFGWLAIGLANMEDTHLNGMNGASIIMAVPGGNYAADTGLDLSVDGSVATYKIDVEQTAFRFWSTPIETDETKTTVAEFEDTGCFTALTFESDHINGIKFNLNGTDEMIWGGNSNDIWMAYHGSTHRKRFTIDWNPPADEGEDDKSGASMKSGFVGAISLAFALTVLIL
ncbi:hypothetical protein ACHAXA_009614 [Cyclostephanos tholiformis]|uniref:Uncharacterized protein n=1 Tax=Cyclostephanos tholiformis TaxID=382380 RepID=A0ABD3RJP9_9STRA